MTGSSYFVSYSRDAAEFVTWLTDQLRSENQTFWSWVDPGQVKAGQWDRQIAKSIEECTGLLFVMTPDSVRDESICKNEWTHALDHQKPVLPLRLKDVRLPFRLNNQHYVDFVDDRETGLAELRSLLAETTERTAVQCKNEGTTTSQLRPLRRALAMICVVVAVGAIFGGWWLLSRSNQSELAPVTSSTADSGSGSGFQSGMPSTPQLVADPNNPCWVGAVCLWELAEFAGRHRTFWERGEWSLADREFVGVATSACNNTDGTARLIGYSEQYGEQELLLQEGQCVSHLGEEARTPEGTSWKSSIKTLRISKG